MTSLTGSFGSVLLDRLERREAALLSWGIVDGGFSDNEITALVDEALDAFPERDADVDETLEGLEFAGLLHRDDLRGNTRWRTRSAETIRLLASLRQLFPKHAEEKRGWVGAATLVAGYRYALRPRSYPKRNLKPDCVVDGLGNHISNSNQETYLRALLESPDRRLELSHFQLRSTRQVLANLKSGKSRGVIVGAGTGSGKTLAFYLPALTAIAELCDDSHWTKALAIYPRKELLKDQLAQAYEEARRLDGVVSRPISIGPYYGDTPTRAEQVKKKWRRGGKGFLCPFMPCPDCGEDLAWSAIDVEKGVERLGCTGCSAEVQGDRVLLTRDRMRQAPPDILFTTTEMLNRQMANIWQRHVFGVQARLPPLFMLLDEVHTYDGVSGAQTAMLIRRWRRAVGASVCFVGLSATLRDAGHFFSQLTGIGGDAITYVRPEPRELTYEGSEYLLALRSDPGSGASVLSTTIQTAMLLTRCLDPLRGGGRQGPSKGIYGEKTFVFTDALDVLNRLYFDISDAEGLDSWGKPVKESLATLRNPTNFLGTAEAAGQSWDLPVAIGHQLSPGYHLRIGRTSSQDVGVNREAEIIVATASLEVGFNDPAVGAVIQHKAPRGAAAFLQRKGRAGRTRRMRPWTVVVLSDYGRDREAYQAYDLLFDPELPARNLPIRNTYVLRVHAVHALFEWITTRFLPGYRTSVRDDVSRPATDERSAKKRQLIADEIEKVLTHPEARADFARYVGKALELTPNAVDEILWSPPRPVLTSALPTLLRRLRSNWAKSTRTRLEPRTDRYNPFSPLPDYVPPNLFDPLDLPEAIVHIPPQRKHDESSEEPMPVIQALKEFAPGRVSRRFGINNTYSRHWLAPGQFSDERSQEIQIDDAYTYESLGTCRYRANGVVKQIKVLRPDTIRTVKAPQRYLDSSNSWLEWHTEIGLDAGDHATHVDIPGQGRFAPLFSEITAFLHANRSPAIFKRFSRAADASLRLREGGEVSTRLNFVRREGEQVALGSFFPVDAIRLRIPLADLTWVTDPQGSGVILRGFRSQLFNKQFLKDPELREYANEFRLQWIHDALIASLVEVAEERQGGLEAAFALISRSLAEHLLRTVSHLLDQGVLPTETEMDADQDLTESRVLQALADILEQPEAQDAIRRLAPLLWSDPTAEWVTWAEERFLSTVGNAVLAALYQLCPEFPESELTLDLDFEIASSETRHPGVILISETTIGGAGFLERAIRLISSDPRRFLRLFETALQPSDLEIIDTHLRAFLDAVRDPALAGSLARYRQATDHNAYRHATEDLLQKLREAGIATNHVVVSALTNRVLRPGSTLQTDDLLRDLIAKWDALEERLGIEVDVRAFALHASNNAEIQDHLAAVGSPSGQDHRQWRYDVLSGLLWQRGWRTKGRSLVSYNPFRGHPAPSPALVSRSLTDDTPRVTLESEDWLAQCADALASRGQVILSARSAGAGGLSDAIATLSTCPVEAKFLHLYPAVVAFRLAGLHHEAHLEIREIV